MSINKNNLELRQDPITKEWVIISPNRSKKHINIQKQKREVDLQNKDPFWDPQKSGNEKPSFIKPNIENWKVQIFPNKKPALKSVINLTKNQNGPYNTLSAFGFHDLIVTKSQTQNFSELSKEDALLVFQGAKERYKFMQSKKIKYAMMFQNWGPTAGASVPHPHYQIIGLPIIPNSVLNSLNGADKYYKKNHSYGYSDIIKFEKKYKKRILSENEHAISFTRFASKEPFDFRVFPKKQIPEFSRTNDKILEGVVEVLQKSLTMLKKNVKDPDYNFYIHSSPLDKINKYYHWHIDVIPRVTISAGVEYGLGVEITVLDPDESAFIIKND